jgi:hypothetical protein
MNAIQKPPSGLKNVVQSLTKHFKGSGFIELHIKLDADTLHDFAIHCRQNKTWNWKSFHVIAIHVHSMMSCGRLMQ